MWPPRTHLLPPEVVRGTNAVLRPVTWLTAPLGRLLLSAIFLMSGADKIFQWSRTAEQMSSEGMVLVPVFLLLAVVFELAGGLSILLGIKARVGAFALIVFLVPVTLIFHDFWQYEGEAQMRQMIQFVKNLAILGGLCVVLTHGAGPVSYDQLKRKKNT
jgi:putative oxidoreductase